MKGDKLAGPDAVQILGLVARPEHKLLDVLTRPSLLGKPRILREVALVRVVACGT